MCQKDEWGGQHSRIGEFNYTEDSSVIFNVYFKLLTFQSEDPYLFCSIKPIKCVLGLGLVNLR